MPIRTVSQIRRLVLSLTLMITLTPLARAQTWNETGDAGHVPGLAQVTAGTGPLATINGELNSPGDADMYCIRLSAVPPAGLPLINLVCATDQGPNVYLFNSSGVGVQTNYTCFGGLKSILAPSISLVPGTYYVAVSYTGWQPLSAFGLIWQTNLPGSRAPDGPGAGFPILGYGGGPQVAPVNPYSVSLASSYISFCDTATPATPHTWGALKLRYGW